MEGGVTTRKGWCYAWRVVLPVEGGVTHGGYVVLPMEGERFSGRGGGRKRVGTLGGGVTTARGCWELGGERFMEGG